MGSASRRWALNHRHSAYGDELRDEVAPTLPKIVKLVLEESSFDRATPSSRVDAVITDLDGTEARLGRRLVHARRARGPLSEPNLAW